MDTSITDGTDGTAGVRTPLQRGVHIIPTMPVHDVVALCLAAEELGYDYCLIADEGLTPDVYVCLGAVAERTSQIRLGPVTNGYTRHPSVTAAAVATLDALSGGRALVTLVPGGSMVLDPIGLRRDAPMTVLRETVDVLRQLWSGEAISWAGKRFSLTGAQLHHLDRPEVPIWVAGRGDRTLALAGQIADGVMFNPACDLGPAIECSGQSASGRLTPPVRILAESVAHTPSMIAEAARVYAYVVLDSPPRVLDSMGVSNGQVELLAVALEAGGPDAAAARVTMDMIRRALIAGTPDECRDALHRAVLDHDLDVFVLNLMSSDLETNLTLMRDVRDLLPTNERLTE